MSIDAINWAWKQAVTPTEKLVLVNLADRFNDEKQVSYPSTATIARDTGLADSTVRLALAHLSELGLLRIERRPGGPGRRNQYRLPIPPTVGGIDLAGIRRQSAVHAPTASGSTADSRRRTSREPFMNRESPRPARNRRSRGDSDRAADVIRDLMEAEGMAR